MNWRVVPRKERKLRERIYKGIPDAWRAPAWGLLVERYAGVSRERWAELGAQYRVRNNTRSSIYSSDIYILGRILAY